MEKVHNAALVYYTHSFFLELIRCGTGQSAEYIRLASKIVATLDEVTIPITPRYYNARFNDDMSDMAYNMSTPNIVAACMVALKEYGDMYKDEIALLEEVQTFPEFNSI